MLFVLSFITLIIYGIANFFYLGQVDDGRKQAYFRIIRNGDGTISLEQRQLFGFCWDCVHIESPKSIISIGNYTSHPLEETPENLAYANRELDGRVSDIAANKARRLQEEADKKIRVDMQRKSDKIIRKHP